MKKYQQAMSRLELTDEMHERILTHLCAWGAASVFKTVCFPRRTLSVAACLVVLLAGVLALPRLLPGYSSDILAVPDIAEATSAAELSDLVGFPVEDISTALSFGGPGDRLYRLLEGADYLYRCHADCNLLQSSWHGNPFRGV